jgi:glutamine synthetase
VADDHASDPHHAEFALASDQRAILDDLEASALAVEILGADIVEGVLAVRRHEQKKFNGMSAEDIAQSVRFAWS